ncbi:MAG: PAS domain-containing protein, partial [Ignavibacteriales bacterium]|nr:PAS domain-containing protein [Ignavibacteriales bacterium]
MNLPSGEKWFLSIFSRICDLHQNVIGVQIISQDISSHRLAELALQKASEEIHYLYNHAPCGYHSVDTTGIFVRINETELEWLGYLREELIGKMQFADLLTPASRK